MPNDAVSSEKNRSPVGRPIFRAAVEIVFVCLILTVRLFPVVFSFLTLIYFRLDKDFATLAETSLILLSAANATSFVASVCGWIYYRRKTKRLETLSNCVSDSRNEKAKQERVESVNRRKDRWNS